MQLDFEPRYAQALLNYLAGQKWSEVQALIPPLLQQMEAAQRAAQEAAGEANGARVVPMHQPA